LVLHLGVICTAGVLMARFHKLLCWMEGQKLDQLSLTAALNVVRSSDLRPHSKSEIGRLINGKVRFVDPFLAEELEKLTAGEIRSADYLAHVADATKARMGLAAPVKVTAKPARRRVA
jgi:hypothetical protein